jgi:hypothetical protein
MPPKLFVTFLSPAVRLPLSSRAIPSASSSPIHLHASHPFCSLLGLELSSISGSAGVAFSIEPSSLMVALREPGRKAARAL